MQSHYGGTHADTVVAYQSFTRSQALRFKSNWILPTVAESAVTQLAWSPWISIHKTSLSPFDKVSILAVSRNDGSVHLVKIVINTESRDVEILEMNANMVHKLVPKQRIPVSKLAWMRREDDLILFTTRNGSLTVSTIPIDNILKFSSLQTVICRHENFSPVVGNLDSKFINNSDLIISVSQEYFNIFLVSQLLPVITFRLSLSNELELLPSSTDFEDFFSSKRDAYTPTGTKSFFKVYGVHATCNSVAITFYYEYVTDMTN